MSRSWHVIYLVVIGGLVATIAWLVTAKTESPNDSRSNSRISAIAILPFVSIGTDPSLGGLSQTITEDIAHALGSHGELDIVWGDKTQEFAGVNIELNEIGWQLGVEAVLEGGVRRFGRNVRVTAQLINAESGYHLWSGEFEAPPDEIGNLVATIDREIVSNIQP